MAERCRAVGTGDPHQVAEAPLDRHMQDVETELKIMHGRLYVLVGAVEQRFGGSRKPDERI
jgi:hypothetical protein